MTSFSDALLMEYADLHRRRAEEIVRISKARLAIEGLNRKIAGFSALLSAYALQAQAEADSYLAECYSRGFPDDILLDVVGDILGQAQTPESLKERIASLNLRRPEGWTSEQARLDMDNGMLDTVSETPVLGIIPNKKPPNVTLTNYTEETQPHRAATFEPAPVAPSPALDTPAPAPVKASAPVTVSAPQTIPAVAPAIPVVRSPKHGQHTPEREVIMRREYPIGTSRSKIREMLNALPGGKFPLDTDIPLYAGKFRLKRPPGYQAEERVVPPPSAHPAAHPIERAKPALPVFPAFLRSPSRDLIVKIDREEGVPDLEIMERVNATPGIALTLGEIAVYAAAIQIEREGQIEPEVEREPTAREASVGTTASMDIGTTASMDIGTTTATARGVRSRSALRSPERDAIMRLDWPNGVPPDEIMAKLNNLPGSEVNSQNIGVYACTLRLNRPAWYRSEVARRSGLQAHTPKVPSSPTPVPPESSKPSPEPALLPAPQPAPQPEAALGPVPAEPVAITQVEPAPAPTAQAQTGQTRPGQSRPNRWYPSQSFVSRHLQGKKDYPSQDDIAAHIQAKGVTKLPAAIVADTTAELSIEDRKKLSEHASEMQAAWEAANMRSRQHRKPARKLDAGEPAEMGDEGGKTLIVDGKAA